MKIAIAQLNPTIGDLINNSNQILQAAQQVADQGVDLLLTPELSLCGYPPRDLLLKSSFLTAMAEQLAKLASKLPPDLYVLVGTIQPNSEAEVKGQKPLFNSVACLYQGKIQEYFHKRLLPTYDVFDEDRYFAPGEKTGILRLVDRSPEKNQELTPELNPAVGRELTIGVTICEDLWNDEEFWGKRSYAVNPIAELGKGSVDLVVNLSASPYCVGKQKVREAMIAHSAKHYQQAIIYVNQVGGNDDLIFDGGSFACDRTGKLIHRAATFRPDLTILEFDIPASDSKPVPQTSQTIPEATFVTNSQPILKTPTNITLEITSLTVSPTPDLLPSEIKTPEATTPGEIWQALVLGVQDYAHKCGFRQVVLGLSGGVDSALVAAIATAALGAENVWGILMPSPYSSEHSVADALELAQTLGIHTQTLPIGDLMQGFDRTLEPLFAGTTFGIAEENIQSRIRGTLLMAIANKFGYLLLSTGNKSEMAVGYCTLYGDMNGGLAVIADVPKTQVYAVCDWLNASHPHLKIPQHILTKAPSAELKPGQVDQDSLPAYEILDEILDRLICQHQSSTEIMAAGFDRPIVEQVVKLVTRAEFKRRQAPPGLKITDRAFGTGWRMPIAARWP